MKYAEFVDEFPRSARIDEAQAALKQLRAGTLPGPAGPSIAEAAAATPVAAAPEANRASTSAPVPPPAAAIDTTPAMPAAGPAHSTSGLAFVSGIRHWSTPTYTRVAIDLGDEVKYEAARVPHPDRIYFDLHGTKLAHELVGKSFTVTDDGFLRRIRVAQYSDTMTRVVLDVNDVTEYSAFLLPNPYRLIIDIHGGKIHSGDGQGGHGPSSPTAEQASGSPASAPASRVNGADPGTAPPQTPPKANAAAAETGEPASLSPADTVRRNSASTSAVAAVPSTVATRNTAPHEVSSLSQQPGKQRATASPTSQPIAVLSPGASAAPESSSKQPAEKASRQRGAKAEPAESALGRAAEPTADGQRSLVRALGLKIGRIVIDPGHGGHDSGTLGVGGIMEKDVVLDVALRLGKLLQEHLGAEIIYTRTDDTFVPLETRTAIANKAEADLFVSVHANSSGDETARGVETYYLNFTSQPDALDVAARENAVSEQSVHQLADLVKKITLKDKIDESREFAADVEKSLYDGLRRGNTGLKDRGVKKAPFVVLIGANMPSILTEISFVTNGRDAAQLGTGAYRERVAESIYKGIARYTGGLSGVRIAGNSRGEFGAD